MANSVIANAGLRRTGSIYSTSSTCNSAFSSSTASAGSSVSGGSVSGGWAAEIAQFRSLYEQSVISKEELKDYIREIMDAKS